MAVVPEVKSGASGNTSASPTSGPSLVGAAIKKMRKGMSNKGTGVSKTGAVINSMEGSSTPSALSPTSGAAILSHITNAVLSLHTQYARY